MIKVKNVTKTYNVKEKRKTIHAVNNISFEVNQAEIIGLLGPNGAGKTTTIKMICGLLVPDSGTIAINGLDLQKDRLKARQHISTVLEGNRNLYWRLSVRENLEYFAGNRGLSKNDVRKRIDELLKEFRLKDKQFELVNKLSRGMQQKLAIAVAMIADSEVVLLDEPTLGLDVETSYEVRQLLKNIVKNYEKTIIISTHDMDVVQDLCERTIIVNHGEIVTDDRVDHLLSLFEVRTYMIKLGDVLNAKQHQELEKHFPTSTYTEDVSQSAIEIDFLNHNQIYDLFDILKINETPVESIDRQAVNFEQVFMRILKGENHHEVS